MACEICAHQIWHARLAHQAWPASFIRIINGLMSEIVNEIIGEFADEVIDEFIDQLMHKFIDEITHTLAGYTIGVGVVGKGAKEDVWGVVNANARELGKVLLWSKQLHSRRS